TGATYTTPVLTSDSVFYVAASSGPKEERVPSPPAGLEYISLNSGQGVSFIVNNLVTINTVDMYVRNNSVGNATVQILITEPDLSDTVFYGPVHSFTAQTTPALEVVPVQATLVPGSYRMVMLYSGINGAVRTLVSSVGGGNLPY